MPDGTYIVNKAKGIHKPAYTKYALSVRQTLASPYPDREPVIRQDGSWRYLYHQELDEPDNRDNVFTNRAMMDCFRDSVPVGVMRQISSKPNVRYVVWGLALVAGWHDGYFILEGLSINQNTIDTFDQEPNLSPSIEFTDERQRIFVEAVRRQGQSKFRQTLIDAYSGICAVTGYQVEEVLEAAHISPYRGPDSNIVSNGILLRSDIHSLFDQGLLTIDDNMCVIIASQLDNTEYYTLNGSALRLPQNVADHPSIDLLRKHRMWCGIG